MIRIKSRNKESKRKAPKIKKYKEFRVEKQKIDNDKKLVIQDGKGPKIEKMI